MPAFVEYKGSSEEVYDAVEYVLRFKVSDEQFLTDSDNVDYVKMGVREAARKFAEELFADSAFTRDTYRDVLERATVHEVKITVLRKRGQS